ncbi:MAG: hypothetical protein ABL886_06160, partial [Rhodoglobus sp.]
MTNRDQVLLVRNYFSNIGLWDHSIVLNPAGWLRNFDEVDQHLAIALLDGFVYLNNEMTMKLFRAGIQRLGTREYDEGTIEAGETIWFNLLERALFSFPSTNPTDSGHMFVRRVRDDFEVHESRILDLRGLVASLSAVSEPRPLILVDDFIGTGDQFLRRIKERWPTPTGDSSLLGEIERLGITELFYVVAVATGIAKDRIESSSSFLVSAGNVLP